MSVKKDIFKDIGDYLMNVLQVNDPVNFPSGILKPEMNLPGLRWFDKQMGQFDNPEMFYAIPLPGVLMEFGQFQWVTIGQNQQRGNGIIRFYIYFENYADSFNGSINQEMALRFFEFTEQVHLALQGFALPYMTPLERTGDNEDTAQDMIITSMIEYSTIITDTVSDLARNQVLADADVNVQRVKQITRPAGDTFASGFIIT